MKKLVQLLFAVTFLALFCLPASTKACLDKCPDCYYWDDINGDELIQASECFEECESEYCCGYPPACRDCCNDSQCTDPSEPACNTLYYPDQYTCVECDGDDHCASNPVNKICNIIDYECVECNNDADCASKTPKDRCDLMYDTRTCVECITDPDCSDMSPKIYCSYQDQALKCVQCDEQHPCTFVCEICNDDDLCELVIVDQVNGVGGTNYYQGTELSVSAVLSDDGGLPDNCDVIFGGDADFSNVQGLYATATLNGLGANLKITARTTAQLTPAESQEFTVAKISQFNADATKFPVCQNANISDDDFVIITDPSGYEDEVQVTGLTTASAGTHKAYATLWEEPEPALEASYGVVGSGDWVAVPPDEIIPPTPPSGSVSASNSHTGYHDGGVFGSEYWIKTTATFTGVYIWNQIGSMEVMAPDGYVTTDCTKWELHAEVGGKAEVGVPLVGSLELSVTVGGSWETATSHTLTSSPTPPGPPYYLWRYRHYQKCSGLQKTVSCLKSYDGPNGPWTSYTQEGITGSFDVGLQGTTDYKGTKEKKCP